MDKKTTLIIGLGNPILGDDGVGWKIVSEFEQQISRKNNLKTHVELDYASLGGLSLMERLTGYKRVILVDAIYTQKQPVGKVSQFVLSDLPDLTAGHSTSAHDTSLLTALNVGRSMGIPLPDNEAIIIIAVEAKTVYNFSEQLSQPVKAAVLKAVDCIMKLIE